MSINGKSKVRLNVENLEERQVLSASPGLGAVKPALAGAQMKVLNQAPMNVELGAERASAKGAPKVAADRIQRVLIINSTTASQTFRYRWTNSSTVFQFTVAPGKSHVITNQVPFWSFAPNLLITHDTNSSLLGNQWLNRPRNLFVTALGFTHTWTLKQFGSTYSLV